MDLFFWSHRVTDQWLLRWREDTSEMNSLLWKMPAISPHSHLLRTGRVPSRWKWSVSWRVSACSGDVEGSREPATEIQDLTQEELSIIRRQLAAALEWEFLPYLYLSPPARTNVIFIGRHMRLQGFLYDEPSTEQIFYDRINKHTYASSVFFRWVSH